MSRNQPSKDLEVDLAFEGLGRKSLLLNAQRLVAASDSSPSILLAIEDVTMRRQFEAASRGRIAELAAADRSKDEFLAMLAHELRNPCPLRNSLHLVKHPKADAAIVSRAWDVMDRQATSMTRLIDDLLDVARVTRGHIELQREVVDLTAVVERSLESITRP